MGLKKEAISLSRSWNLHQDWIQSEL